MSPESPTPENPEDDEEEDEDREEGGTEDTPPEDPEDDGEGNGEGEDGGEDGFDWNSIDMKDTSTWPSVPSGGTYGISGTFTVGLASKDKYGERRGEKSLYDSNGGEWRPHKPDSSHDPHWNYKPYLWNDNQNMNIGQWIGVDLSGERYN